MQFNKNIVIVDNKEEDYQLSTNKKTGIDYNIKVMKGKM